MHSIDIYGVILTTAIVDLPGMPVAEFMSVSIWKHLPLKDLCHENVRCIPRVTAAGKPAFAQERPWQQISDPTAARLAANFAAPPSEYGSQFDCGFSDTRTRADIGAMLDRAKAVNVQAAFIDLAAATPLSLAGLL